MITQDVRPDLTKDHKLWADVLAQGNCLHEKYDELKVMLGFLRRAECELWMEKDKLCFRFNRNNLNSHMIKRATQILKPYKVALKTLFEKVSKKHAKLNPKQWKEDTPF